MTDMQKSDGAILEIDHKGRVQRSAARRESLLDEFERSGLSGPKFAALAGIKYQTFAAWSLRRRKCNGHKAAAKAADQLRWLEAVVDQAQTSVAPKVASLMLQLPGGAWIELNWTRRNKRLGLRCCCACWKSHAEFFRQFESLRVRVI